MALVGKTGDEDECWVWMGQKDRDGYGTFWFRRRNRRAHRVSYWASCGDIPEGLVIDHLCRNHWCVNPQHLQCVTVRENALIGDSVAAKNARKTHCPKGHAYDRHYGKQRYCSICEKAKRARLRAKWAAEDTVAC